MPFVNDVHVTAGKHVCILTRFEILFERLIPAHCLSD